MLALILASLLAGAAPGPFNFGTNIAGWNDYTNERDACDAMKAARRWSTTTSSTDYAAPTDANGWPVTDGQVYAMTAMLASDKGAYSLRFSGQATLALGGVTTGWTISGQSYSGSGTNITTATVTNDGTATQLDLVFTNTIKTYGGATNTGVSNVALFRPKCSYGGSEWTPTFLDRIRPFSTLRLMDWLNTNGQVTSTQADTYLPWTDRIPDTAASWTKNPNLSANGVGVPWEAIIRLGNATGKDLWINIPDTATDAYVTSLATLFRSNWTCTNALTGRTCAVYIEWGNEVWNDSFQQATHAFDYAACTTASGSGGASSWAASTAYTFVSGQNAATQSFVTNAGQCYRALSSGTSGATAPTCTGSGATCSDGVVSWSWRMAVPATPALDSWGASTNKFYSRARRVGQRLAQISVLWRAVVGDTAMMSVYRPVLMSQFNTPGFATNGLQEIQNSTEFNAHSVSYYVYGTGGAPYLSPGDNAAYSASDYQVEMHRYEDSVNASLWTQWDTLAHTTWGVKLLLYESGPSLAANTSNFANKLSANTTTGIAAVVNHLWADAQANHADLFLHYNLGQACGSAGSNSGQWGLFCDDFENDAALKWQAALAAQANVDATRIRLNRTILANSITPQTGTDLTTATALSLVSGAVQFTGSSSAAVYSFKAPGAGWVKVVPTVSTSAATASWTVKVNGAALPRSFAVPNTGGTPAAFTNPIWIYVQPGTNTLEIDNTTTDTPSLVSFTLTDS